MSESQDASKAPVKAPEEEKKEDQKKYLDDVTGEMVSKK